MVADKAVPLPAVCFHFYCWHWRDLLHRLSLIDWAKSPRNQVEMAVVMSYIKQKRMRFEEMCVLQGNSSSPSETQEGPHKIIRRVACDLRAASLSALLCAINHCSCYFSCIKMVHISSYRGFSNVNANRRFSFLVSCRGLGYVSYNVTFLISGTLYCSDIALL
jgi:hypothetical protein